MDWFLYDRELGHEIVKVPLASLETFPLEVPKTELSNSGQEFCSVSYFCYNKVLKL